MAYLLDHRYSELVPTNSLALSSYFSGGHSTCINYIWSCSGFQQFALTSEIFNKNVLFPTDHNPVIAHFTTSFLTVSIKKAHAKQTSHNKKHVYRLSATTSDHWNSFQCTVNSLCSSFSVLFPSWSLNRQCEALYQTIVKAA